MKMMTWMAGAALAAGMAGSANADLIAHWNFNGLSIATASAPGVGGVPTAINSDSGTATLSLSGWTGTVDDFAGSTINAVGTDPAEESLSLVSNAGNGSFIQISFSTAGYKDLAVSFATRGTSTGFSAGQWSYSNDGVAFTNFGASTATTSGTFALASVVAPNALNNDSTAFLRYTLSGATSTSGNNRIDNLQLNANLIPEPASLALLGVGLVMIASRRRQA